MFFVLIEAGLLQEASESVRCAQTTNDEPLQELVSSRVNALDSCAT
jgi:hypothetical protein